MRVASESTAVAAEGCGLAGDQGTANPRGGEQMEAKETPLYRGGQQLSVASESTAVVTEDRELASVLSNGMSTRDDLKVAKLKPRNAVESSSRLPQHSQLWRQTTVHAAVLLGTPRLVRGSWGTQRHNPFARVGSRSELPLSPQMWLEVTAG